MAGRSGVLVGRARETSDLRAALLDGLRGDGPSLVLVLGEAGVGKSRLVADLVGAGPDLDGEHVVVCRGAAIQDGATSPLLPWADALRQAVAAYGVDAATRAAGPALVDLAVLVPDLDPGAAPASAGRAADLLPWYVGRLAAVRPLVVVLEDLHLADVTTLSVLCRLVAQPTPGVVVVATARAEGERRDPDLDARWVATSVTLRRLALTVEMGPLAPDDAAVLVAELASAAGASLDPVTVEDIVERAEGNPFFLEELVSVRASGRGTVPPADVLGVRLSTLSGPALAAARAVAVHGGQVPHGVVRELAALDEAVLLDALRELVATDLLVGDDSGESYAFRHLLVGDAVRDGMLPVERRRLHAASARATEARLDGVTSDERRRLLGTLPKHWTEAGRLDLALTAAVRAAEASAVVAPDVAAAHYARALELDALVHGPEDTSLPSGRAHLLEQLAEQHGAAGDGSAATASARAALAIVEGDREGPVAEPARAARLHRLVAVHGEGVLDDGEVIASFEAAVAAAEQLGPSPELAAALAAQARHELVLDHNARAVPLSRRAREIAVAVDAVPEEALAAATLGASLCYLGSFDEGLATLSYAVPALEAAQRPYDAARALLTLVWAQFHGGDPLTGRASAERASAALRDGGGPRDVAARLEAAALEMAVASGHWDHLDEALAVLDGPGVDDPGVEVGSVEGAVLRSVRGELALRRGRWAEAESSYSAVLGHWERLGLRPYDAGSLSRLAEIASLRGDLPAARAFVEEGLEAVEAADTWVASLGYARAGLAVEAVAARGGRAIDQDQVARLVTLLERGQRGAPEGTVAAAELAEARAQLTRITGRDDPEAWGRAVTAWSTVGFPWWRASALLRRAEALVSERGARAEAATLVADVLATTELLGATALAADAHDLARRAGLVVQPAQALPVDPTDEPGRGSAARSVPQQRSPSGGPDRDSDPLESLTSREREVVTLLAAGASNRRIAQQLFISEKTASVHVSHILAKLGVSSRLEAAAVAHRASR